MDSSVSKAVIMVAAVLLAMLVMAFITFSFRRIGSWATTQDDEQDLEQIQEFNKEYEVYDKKLMYGVDVISCLNKALSNNDRITKETVVTGDTYDERYEIKVKLTIKKTLQERIVVYYMGDSGINKGKELEYTDEQGPDSKYNSGKLNELFNLSKSDKITTAKQVIGGINFNSNVLKTQTQPTKISAGTYTLTKKSEDKDPIKALMTCSTEVKQTVKNSKNSAKKDSWTKAVWETPLYDLKTRKFKCTDITYKESGRVDTISFEEISI